MEIEIPTVPLGALTLLAFFAPYAIAALNGALPFVKEPWQKKAVAIVVALALAAVVLAIYFAATGDVPATWWAFGLLAIVVASASYALVTKPTATAIERATEPN